MAELNGTSDYEVIIEPKRGWMRLELRELWEYRDLLMLLLRRDLLARYQQTLLGPLWHLLQPVLTMAVFVIIFTRVAGISTGGVPAPLFYLSGLLAWNYFAQNITTASGTFLNNQGLFSKVWFPRLVVPMAAIASNLVSFSCSSFHLWYSHRTMPSRMDSSCSPGGLCFFHWPRYTSPPSALAWGYGWRRSPRATETSCT
jgi:lipopolysaccharide transport system permease protein